MRTRDVPALCQNVAIDARSASQKGTIDTRQSDLQTIINQEEIGDATTMSDTQGRSHGTLPASDVCLLLHMQVHRFQLIVLHVWSTTSRTTQTFSGATALRAIEYLRATLVAETRVVINF